MGLGDSFLVQCLRAHTSTLFMPCPHVQSRVIASVLSLATPWHRISLSNVSSLPSQEGFSKAAPCWWLSDSSSAQPLTPTSRHPPLTLRLGTHKYWPADGAAPTRCWKSAIWTLTCLQETVYWHQLQHDSLCPRFISRAENQQQQQPAANSPTKVIAVAQKGSSLRYISMSWHSEKYWRYYSMRGRRVPILRRWGWNDTSFMAKLFCLPARSRYFAVRECY